MTKQVIGLGTTANDHAGDSLRVAGTKINSNFTELYDAVSNITALNDVIASIPTDVSQLTDNESLLNGGGTADLGAFKIQGNTLGTSDEGNSWGGSSMNISPNGEGYTWIYVPNDSAAATGSSLAIGNTSPTGGGIQLLTNGGTWNFSNDGSLITPTLSVDLHNGGNQTGQVLQLGNPEQQAIITGPTPAENNHAQRLIIQGQKATGTGEGGDVYVWGGDAEVDGGDIKIYAGDADSTTQGYGGYVNIAAGRGYNEGGNISITAGYGTVNGGDLTLSAGSGGTLNGRVLLNTGNKSWTLANDGSLQLPADGTIKDYSGNILVSSSTFIDLPEWLIAIAGTNHLPTINSDYGWDSNGVWFTNSTIGGQPDEGISYPVRLADSIPASQGVVITVDFDADPTSNDFGIGVWETGTDPVWAWGPASGNVNIGAQYDGTTPVLKAIAGTGVDIEGRYDLPAAGTYRARLTISAPDTDDEITVTLETLDISNNVLDTISYVEPKFTSSYSIGFAADQDNGTDKTYMKNLTVNINNGGTTYDDTLLSYNSIGTTGTGHFSFADNTVTITGQDMQFTTTRAGWDIDCDFDVTAADDVFIEALGDDVGITAANEVNITTGALEMHPNTYYGQEDNFLGTWDGTTLTLNVPSYETTLISLLDFYLTSAGSIWLKTATGYVQTQSVDPASKTNGEGNVTYSIPIGATSPVANADIINIKVHDSINNGTYHDFTFTKSGKLRFPSGGVIEQVGMGWTGLTNGTTGTPVSVVAKNNDGVERSSINVYNSGTSGTAQIYTISAPGIPNTGNYTPTFSTGSWDSNPVTNLNTTGGTGGGLTVDVNQSGSGYADFVTVVNPGNGYVNGETITVTSGEASATFAITVNEQFNEWTFDENGVTSLAGGIKGRVKANTYADSIITLDVNATINKLTPIVANGSNHYYLANGTEGQIMYITLATAGEMSSEYTLMNFNNARWTNGSGSITEQVNVTGWLPFRGGLTNSGSAILTLAFIDGHWNLPHNWFD